jgi:hypothetical protein
MPAMRIALRPLLDDISARPSKPLRKRDRPGVYLISRMTGPETASVKPEASAEILMRIAKRVQGCDHVRPGYRDRRHIFPFTDGTIGPLAGLDHIDSFPAAPLRLNILERIEKFLFTSQL